MSNIPLSVIVYACCLNKTTTKTNKKQMKSSADTFFLNDPLSQENLRRAVGLGMGKVEWLSCLNRDRKTDTKIPSNVPRKYNHVRGR